MGKSLSTLVLKTSLSALLICLISNVSANELLQTSLSDTIKPDTLHSPRKAALLSAIAPSAGQFYNKKYWKMPLVYAGLGTGLYLIIDNNQKFQRFKRDYIAASIDGTYTGNLSSAQLFALQDQHHTWRDYSVLFTSLFYVVQILDAAVDAHFFYFEKKINPDLSFRLSPSLINNGFSQSAGIGLKLHF